MDNSSPDTQLPNTQLPDTQLPNTQLLDTQPPDAHAPREADTEKQDAWRLYVAGCLVAALFSSVFFLIPLPLLSSWTWQHPFWWNALESQLPSSAAAQDYSVLVKQESTPIPAQEISPNELAASPRALSDVNSLGQGGLTEEEGFHTPPTGEDTLEPGLQEPGSNVPGSQEPGANAEKKGTRTEGALAFRQKFIAYLKKAEQDQSRNYQKIPTNYRFRDSLALRFSDTGQLFLPRKQIAGFRYFRRMVRRLGDTFTPLGLNFAYRDWAGTVVGSSIRPQVVQVLFALARNGDVLDAKIYASMGDQAVDAACLATLQEKNFGLPPAEIFADGNIFGISFIFPVPQRQQESR